MNNVSICIGSSLFFYSWFLSSDLMALWHLATGKGSKGEGEVIVFNR